MYLLDTNVVSELRRPDKANPRVFGWASASPVAGFFLSVISILELELGVLMIERRDAAQGQVLRSWLEGQILPQFDGRILPIDAAVALQCARLHVSDPRSHRDAMIAATALVHGMTVATRNVSDFTPTGARTFDPWTGG
jgi:predicted nucleic acid-binding protein